MNILIVGESLPKTYECREPFVCASGERLAQLLDMKFHGEFLEKTDRVNLFDGHVPSHLWNLGCAQLAAEDIRFLARGRCVVLCGARVKAAFGYPKHEFLSAVVERTIVQDGQTLMTKFLFIPHPSGRNRMWNDKALFAEVQDFLADQVGKWIK